jgi:hypothetical protein
MKYIHICMVYIYIFIYIHIYIHTYIYKPIYITLVETISIFALRDYVKSLKSAPSGAQGLHCQTFPDAHGQEDRLPSLCIGTEIVTGGFDSWGRHEHSWVTCGMRRPLRLHIRNCVENHQASSVSTGSHALHYRLGISCLGLTATEEPSLKGFGPNTKYALDPDDLFEFARRCPHAHTV